MSSWFTTEQIDKETYVISEYKHWEETHCYLLNGIDESLLIDTGMGIQNIRDEIRKITNNPIVSVATHSHWDHIGGHSLFPEFYVHEAEADWMNGYFPLTLDYIKNLIVEEPCHFPIDFRLDDYKIFQGNPARILKDKDIINFGGRSIEVIHTPGHSPGHMCLYEAARKYLFSGDLVYKGRLTAFFPTTNPIAYKESIDKISFLQTDHLFPAHHTLQISPKIVIDIGKAFKQLETQGKLKHGSGLFTYEDFQIEL